VLLYLFLLESMEQVDLCYQLELETGSTGQYQLQLHLAELGRLLAHPVAAGRFPVEEDKPLVVEEGMSLAVVVDKLLAEAGKLLVVMNMDRLVHPTEDKCLAAEDKLGLVLMDNHLWEWDKPVLVVENQLVDRDYLAVEILHQLGTEVQLQILAADLVVIQESVQNSVAD